MKDQRGSSPKREGSRIPEGYPLRSEIKSWKGIKERYPDFGPTFAGEKFKWGGICVSRETLRKPMIQEGRWKAKRRKREKIYQRRARKSKEGGTFSRRVSRQRNSLYCMGRISMRWPRDRR